MFGYGAEIKENNGHMVLTGGVRNVHGRWIHLDTKYADHSTGRYVFKLPIDIQDSKTMRLKTIEFSNPAYNISAALGNNTFVVSQNGVKTVVVSIADGFYTKTTLIAAINTILSNGANHFESNHYLIFADVGGYTTFTGNNTHPFSVTISFAVDASGNFDRTHFRDTLGWILGFRMPEYTYNFATSTITKSEAITDLNIFKYLYVCVDEYATGRRNGTSAVVSRSLNSLNILGKVVTNSAETVTLASEEKGNLVSDVREYDARTTINKLAVTLVRDNGHVLDMLGTDISISLFIEA